MAQTATEIAVRTPRIADETERDRKKGDLELYPGFLAAARITFRNSRRMRELGGIDAERGRATGARC